MDLPVLASLPPLAFILTAFAIELTPGPNMTYLAVVALGEGRKAGLATVAGVAIGLAIVGLLAALGLAATIANSPMMFAILRYSGALYLLWLAYDTYRGGSGGEQPLQDGTANTLRIHFFRGLVTNLLNPKAAVFYLAVMPPFVDPARPVLPQTISLSIAYVAVATVVHLSIVLLADRARENLLDARKIDAIRKIMAVSLIGVAVWVLWSTRA